MEAFLERWFTNLYCCFAPCATGVEPDWLEDSNLRGLLTDGFGDRCNRHYAKPLYLSGAQGGT